jgi:hypothetical protein
LSHIKPIETKFPATEVSNQFAQPGRPFNEEINQTLSFILCLICLFEYIKHSLMLVERSKDIPHLI